MKKTFRLIINPFAELDLRSGFEFYELQKTGLGKEFINEVDEAIKQIKANPFNFTRKNQISERHTLAGFHSVFIFI